MTDITPADLAKFIHRVPVGAVIPADTEFVVGSSGTFTLVELRRDFMQPQDALPRWTAEPIPAPESLAEKARRLGGDYPGDSWGRQLATIVAELAERIEAKP